MQGPRANHRHSESGTEQNNRLRESSIVFLALAGGSRNEDGGAGGTRPWPSLCLNNGGRGRGADHATFVHSFTVSPERFAGRRRLPAQSADYKYEIIDEEILEKPRDHF